MESTKRLREWWRDKFPLMDKMLGEEFRWHLDEIEHEVEDNERFRREAEPFHDRLCRASERREDVTLWGVDYTPLPVDADGEYIHVGDVMEWPYGNGEFRVNGIGGNTLFYIDKDSGECEWTAAGDKRHHRAPTVEDVLREFYVYAERGKEHHREDVDDAVLAEYAAKLRLTEGSE